MSRDQWEAIRRTFSDALHDLIRKNGEHLQFSACPDPSNPPDNICDVAKTLCEPVKWLKQQVPEIEWLSIIQYDHHPDRGHSDTHAAHLNFYVKDNLAETFAKEKDKMFLLTGIACGLAGYGPLNRGTYNFTFPKFILHESHETLPDHYGERIEIVVNFDPASCTFGERQKDCGACNNATVNYKVHAPHKGIGDYIKAIPTFSDKIKKATRTLCNFKKTYPVAAVEGHMIQCIFMPVVHMPALPYYVSGVMVLLRGKIDKGKYNILSHWAKDICWPLAGFSALKYASFKGEYLLVGLGEALSKYINDRSTDTIDHTETISWKHSAKKSEPTELHDFLYPLTRLTLHLDSGIVPRDLSTDLARYIESFTRLGFSGDNTILAAWDCLTLAGIANNIHVFFWVAFCQEAGVDANISMRGARTISQVLDKSAQLIHGQSDLDRHSPLALHDVMKWLIQYPMHGYAQGNKSNISLTEKNNRIVFTHRILLKFDGGSKKYFDFSNTDQSQHQLTWVIRSAVALASKSGNVSNPIMGFVDGEVDGYFSKDASHLESLLSHYSEIMNGVWVCPGKGSCFILIKRTFDMVESEAATRSKESGVQIAASPPTPAAASNGDAQAKETQVLKRTFLVCEDDQQTMNQFTSLFDISSISDRYVLKFAFNKDNAMKAIYWLQDDDVISLDSQLPDVGDGNAILEALRRRGCNCLALWHSSVSVPKWATAHCFSFNKTHQEFNNLMALWEACRGAKND